MGRLIALIIIVIAVAWLVKRALRAARAKQARQDAPGQAEPQASQELVRCARCGVLLPRGEARMAAGALYCSQEHASPG
jgi:uncharacterized protein